MDPLDGYLQEFCGYEVQRKITLKNLSISFTLALVHTHYGHIIFPETINFHSPVVSLILRSLPPGDNPFAVNK
jgi:hypothetical protein